MQKIAFVIVLLSSVAAWGGDTLRIEWHKEMARRPVPKLGCFEAQYPGTEWREVPCTTPPDEAYAPGAASPHDHFTAQTAGRISSSVGSFVKLTNVKHEHDRGVANAYSLQLNSNYFQSPTCSSNPKCLGWQQFIYSSKEKKSFIQYWLHDYGGKECPKGWKRHPHKDAPASCFRNSDRAIDAGRYAVTELEKLSLGGGAVADGHDTVTFTTPDGKMHAISESDSVLGLAKRWRDAEFVVVGAGGGSRAHFNDDATIVMETSIHDGTHKAPACTTQVYTAETNNLRLVRPCCTHGGSSPRIVFTLSNAKSAKSHCADMPGD